MTPGSLPQPAALLCLSFTLLIPLAMAGLALMNTGLARSRSASHAMMSSLCVMAVAAIVYAVCGFSVQGFAGQPGHMWNMAGKAWSWIGAGPFLLHGLEHDDYVVPLTAWFGMLAAALAAVVPLGSGSDRWRLSASCLSTVLLAGWTYPLFAHWVWGGGWLAQLGSFYGLGRGFLDNGGAGAIQTVGGLTALSIAWILGPRRGKYAADGGIAAIPGHNAVYVLFGCLLALLGWLGLNSAGAVLFTGAGPRRLALVGINTMLTAGVAALAAAGITRSRFGKPDASLSANGWVGGLVASSAACGFLQPSASIIVGLVAGVVVTLGVEWFEVRLGVDDPGGAISVHAICGIWGLLAAGLFARFPAAGPGALPAHGPFVSATGQLLAQVVGIATLVGFVLPLTYGLNWLLNRLVPLRAAADGERHGMDLHELGAGAYPEFITHSEDFPNW